MWYRLSHIRGEYWLNEGGPEYADGDVGDVNHEMLAESHILGELGNDIYNEWDGGVQTYSSANDMFYDALDHDPIGSMEEYIEELQTKYGEDWREVAEYDDYLIWLNTHRHTDPKMKQIQESFAKKEIAGLKDARLHVAKEYDWVRVQGPYIQVWEMNDLARKRIRKQLDQIYDIENSDTGGEYEDYDAWKDIPKFNLEILSTGKYITNLTYYDLISGGELKRMREPEIMEVGKRPAAPTNIPGYQYSGG
jgi:hypothetical protein